VIEERTVANDNTIAWSGRRLQLPESRLRPHFVKAVVRVHGYPDGTVSVFLGPHRLARFAEDLRFSSGRRVRAGQQWSGGESVRQEMREHLILLISKTHAFWLQTPTHTPCANNLEWTKHTRKPELQTGDCHRLIPIVDPGLNA